MTKFGTLNEAGEVVPYDYGNVCFRQPLSSGEHLLSARHASLDFRLQMGDGRWAVGKVAGTGVWPG
jgi:hypothetical protein